jgi:hypothetical protein
MVPGFIDDHLRLVPKSLKGTEIAFVILLKNLSEFSSKWFRYASTVGILSRSKRESREKGYLS